MNKQDIGKMISKVSKENSLFAKKAALDSLFFPQKILGRQKQAEQLVRYLLGYKQGYVVPYVSVYGRSGSGKSVVVKFVCDNIDDISYRFVNLRQAKTVFGAANLILAELGILALKSAQGINLAIDAIGKEIESVLQQEKKKLFVLVLDELDVIFYDKRGNPSDFVYKLIVLEEKLREKGLLLCIIGISNNVLSEYGLDDRVRSRIGSSEIFFEPYSKSDVLEILKERAKEALVKKPDNKIIEYCAELSSGEHGDARRAIDLLRVSAEIAGSKGEDIANLHVELASQELQKDRISQTLSSASYHLRIVCLALARITFLSDQDWHATSVLYKQYERIISDTVKPLSYRRISELLTELENTGLVISQTGSKGRHGYGTQYKLAVSPEMVGDTIDGKFWAMIVKTKIRHKENMSDDIFPSFGNSSLTRSLRDMRKQSEQASKAQWKEFVGI